MKRKDPTPLIMWFVLVGGIAALALVRLGRPKGIWDTYSVNFDAVFIGLYALWMIVELQVSRRDVDTEGKKTSDSATCQLYGIGQALTILTALWFPSVWRGPNVAHLLGTGVFLCGIGYRLWAVHTLGQFYSHRVQTLAQHRIVASGPYRHTRHPAYAGMIIANAGIALYFLNWVTACVFLFILVPAILWRIAIEEKTLFGIEGYAEFAKHRKRLFPAVW
jgi:protein-S-isoprenylcysteine O-methyltransferase Ste14